MENRLFDGSPTCRRSAPQAAWRAGAVLPAASEGVAGVSPSTAAASIRFRSPFVPLQGGSSGIACMLATGTRQPPEWPAKAVTVLPVASTGNANLSTAEVLATASLEKHTGTTLSACTSVCPHISCAAVFFLVCVCVCVCACVRPRLRLQLIVPSATPASVGKRNTHACDHKNTQRYGTISLLRCLFALFFWRVNSRGERVRRARNRTSRRHTSSPMMRARRQTRHQAQKREGDEIMDEKQSVRLCIKENQYWRQREEKERAMGGGTLHLSWGRAQHALT